MGFFDDEITGGDENRETQPTATSSEPSLSSSTNNNNNDGESQHQQQPALRHTFFSSFSLHSLTQPRVVAPAASSNEHDYALIAERSGGDGEVDAAAVDHDGDVKDEPGEEEEVEEKQRYAFGTLEPSLSFDRASLAQREIQPAHGQQGDDAAATAAVEMDFDRTAFREGGNVYDEEDEDEEDRAMVVCTDEDDNTGKVEVDKEVEKILDDDDGESARVAMSRLNESKREEATTDRENVKRDDKVGGESEPRSKNRDREQAAAIKRRRDKPIVDADDNVRTVKPQRRREEDVRMDSSDEVAPVKSAVPSCGCRKSTLRSRNTGCHHHHHHHHHLRGCGGNKRRTRNPFIAFFLSMYRRRPRKRVTEVARQAGRQWCRMSDRQKDKYRHVA